jgi:hypothetical protein
LLYNSKKYINFMLIIEIILTIVAWRKGWNWLAIIPVGIAFCIGLIIGASGTPIDNPMSVIIWDILAIIALIVMVAVNPPGKKIEPTKPVDPPTT